MKPGDMITVREVEDEGAAPLPTRLGHFEIVGRLGAGGMGLVFEGRDTVLDRRVALKLLHPATANGAVAPARLLREAQALAKLQHPNVVTVFEVGMMGADQFIAMELVEGRTLLEWMTEPRDWREVLDIFIAVGHGLAAVHALGLVHRDFKPSNVLVDTNGRPKLGDFGLVGAIDDPDAPAPEISDHALTTPGQVMGTPAYMAPEQRNGEPVDARADQYSFAKSLREALGDTVPAAVVPILDRAQADEPDERYPAMEPLLAELARVRRGRARIWIAAGGIAVIAIAIVVAWSFGRTSAVVEDPCQRPTARMDGVWGTPRRSALEQHLAAIDPALGKQRFTLASSVLDGGATRWQDLHVEACQQNRDGLQSDTILDHRMSCLDQALFEIDETVKTLEGATDGRSLDRATRAASTLPTLNTCADLTALADRVPRPTSPIKRAEADAIAREAIDIDVALRAGGSLAVGARAEKAVQRARALEHPASVAIALTALAATHHANEQYTAEVKALREAVVAAATAHDDRLLAELWSKQLTALLGAELGYEARSVLPAAEAANARINAPLELRSQFVASKAELLGAFRDVDEARKLLDPMIKEVAAAKLVPIELALRRSHINLAEMSRDFPRMDKETEEVIPLLEATYGKDHPDVADMHRLRGVALFGLRKFPDSQVEMLEAVRISEARLAPSPRLAQLLYSVGATFEAMGKPEKGRPFMKRAMDMARATLPAGDVRLAQYIIGLAAVAEDDATIKKGFLEALPILENGPRPTQQLASLYFNLARLEHEQHRYEAALALYAKADKEGRARGGNDKTQLAIIHAAEAACYIRLKQYPAAVEASARGLTETEHPVILNQVRFTHGTARVRAGDPGGKAELEAARAELKKLGAGDPDF